MGNLCAGGITYSSPQETNYPVNTPQTGSGGPLPLPGASTLSRLSAPPGTGTAEGPPRSPLRFPWGGSNSGSTPPATATRFAPVSSEVLDDARRLVRGGTVREGVTMLYDPRTLLRVDRILAQLQSNPATVREDMREIASSSGSSASALIDSLLVVLAGKKIQPGLTREARADATVEALNRITGFADVDSTKITGPYSMQVVDHLQDIGLSGGRGLRAEVQAVVNQTRDNPDALLTRLTALVSGDPPVLSQRTIARQNPQGGRTQP